MSKPILCLDFDGVIHSYSSGWKGADVIPDPPVAGAMRFIWDAAEHFRIAVFSSRSGQPGGKRAMASWLAAHFREHWAADRTRADDILAEIEWPQEKPPAFLTIDDRALTFNGVWPPIDLLKQFQPWNKRPLGPTGEHPRGQISADDDGAIKIGVAADKQNGIVRIEFGTNLSWVGLDYATAIKLAESIKWNAGKIKPN